MKKQLLKILNVEPEEANRVYILLGMGFFMGIFLATFEVSSITLFLANFDETHDLPIAIVASGFIGLVLTFLFNQLQSRIRFQYLGLIVLLLLAATVTTIRIGHNVLEDRSILYYVAFVVAAPFSYLSLLVFWGVFGRIFDLRQAKRIIGSIDTGTLIASIVALFSIPILLNTLETYNLLIISLAAAIGFLMMFIVVIAQYKLTQLVDHSHKTKNRVNYSEFFRNKYMVLMAVFVVASVVAVTFIDYSFAHVATDRFPDERDLGKFLSYFEATVVIFSFMFQTFITDKIIEIYGLKVALIANPILISIFTGGALVTGMLLGYTADSELFFYFFTAIAASKLFIDSIKDALDGPAFKLYFLPIDKNIKFDVQTKVEGVVNTFAYLLGGALIILINNVGLNLMFITIFLLPVLALWYFVINRMHGQYRFTLQDSLVKNKSEAKVRAKKEYSINRILENEINSEQDEKIIYGLKLMERLEPSLFESSILQMVDNPSKAVQEYAREKVKSLDLEYDKGNSEIRTLAEQALGNIEDNEVISITPDRLQKLSKSVKQEDRILAAKLLRKLISDKNIFVLLELLRDVDPEVKMTAVVTARKVKRKETWSILIEMLDSPVYSHAASAALKQTGEPVLPALETAFHRSGQSDMVKLKIVQIMSRIGGEHAIKLLWEKIDLPDAKIVRQVLYALRYYDYTAKEGEISIINGLLDHEMGKAFWNLAAYDELPKSEAFKPLARALKEEIDTNFEHITMLLSILYDPDSVQLVKENIDSGTTEGVAFAIELLDLFVDQELKPRLYPLLDDIDIKEKIRILQVYYPRQTYNPVQVLNYILNRDFNQNNRWTKACAMHGLAHMDEFKVSKGLIAQLFNPDMLLAEAAAWVLHHKERETYDHVSQRLPKDVKRFLDDSIAKNQLEDGLDDGFFLKIEIGMFLRDIPVFSNIKGTLLAELIDKIKTIHLDKGKEIFFEDIDDERKPIFIIAHGECAIENNGKAIHNLKMNDVWGEIFTLGYLDDADALIATQDSILFEINLNDFYSVLSNQHELAQDFINTVSKDLKKQLIKQ